MSEHTEEERAIMAVIDAESAAFFAGDLDTQLSHWAQTEEVRRIWSGPQTGTAIAVGFDQVRALFEAGMRLYPSEFDAREYLDRKNIQICCSGDMAWVYYDQGLKKNHPRFRTQTDQKELKILHKISGVWKIACISIVAPALMKENVAQIRLSSDGEVTRMSDAARAKLESFPGLVIRGNRVYSPNRDRDKALQNEISNRLMGLKNGLVPSLVNRGLRAVSLGADDFSRPLHCWVFVEGDELVITFDTGQSIEERLDDAAKAFALSKAQRNLAGFLAEGQNLADIAETLGVSVNTIKTHLRRMFEKTGTNDQAGLLALLLSVDRPTNSPPALPAKRA